MQTRICLSALVCLLFSVIASDAYGRPPLRAGDFLVADFGLQAIVHVDAITGNRTVLSSPLVGGGPPLGTPSGIAIGANGQIIVTNGIYETLVAIDPTDGTRTEISGLTKGIGIQLRAPYQIAFEPSGFILVADAVLNGIVRVDPISGDRSILTDAFVGTGPVVVNSDGLIYVGDQGLDAVVAVDPISGNQRIVSGRNVGSGPILDGPKAMIRESDSSVLVGDASNLILRVDLESGDRQAVSGNLFSDIRGIALADPETVIAVDLVHDALIAVNMLTGEGKVISSCAVGSGPCFIHPSGIAIIAIPEPSAAILTLIGVVIAWTIRRRRYPAENCR